MINVSKNVLFIKDPNTGQYQSVSAIVGESAYETAVRNGFNGDEEDWINSLIKIDNTLTKSNMGADAKVVGNKITELENTISELKKMIQNLASN